MRAPEVRRPLLLLYAKLSRLDSRNRFFIRTMSVPDRLLRYADFLTDQSATEVLAASPERSSHD